MVISIEKYRKYFFHLLGIPTGALLLFSLFGCSVARPPLRISLPPVNAVYDIRWQKNISPDDLFSVLAQKDVIYVPETHNKSEDHRIQRLIIQELMQNGFQVVVAMEMFAKSLQPELDKWSLALTDQKTFLENVNWKKTWGYPFSLYRDIVFLARHPNVKLVAINAERHLIKKIARNTINGLLDMENEALPNYMVMDNKKHREFVKKHFSNHGHHTIRNFEGFYQAQVVWEETMAEAIAKIIETTAKEKQKIVVLAGKGHVINGFGIPERAHIRADHKYSVVLPVSVGRFRESMYEKNADFIWITQDKFQKD